MRAVSACVTVGKSWLNMNIAKLDGCCGVRSRFTEMYHDRKNPDMWWVILFGLIAVGIFGFIVFSLLVGIA
mgnify:CR=1 FL=1